MRRCRKTRGLLDTLLADRANFVRRLRINVASLINLCSDAKFLPWPLVALALLGIVGWPWDGRRLRGELLLLALLAGPLSYLAFFVTARYLAGLLLPALVWIGGGLALMGEWLADTWTQAR